MQLSALKLHTRTRTYNTSIRYAYDLTRLMFSPYCIFYTKRSSIQPVKPLNDYINFALPATPAAH